MALIYLLHNLIKASARSKLIESSNLPWILLSSLQLLPKHPSSFTRVSFALCSS